MKNAEKVNQENDETENQSGGLPCAALRPVGALLHRNMNASIGRPRHLASKICCAATY